MCCLGRFAAELVFLVGVERGRNRRDSPIESAVAARSTVAPLLVGMCMHGLRRRDGVLSSTCRLTTDSSEPAL